MLTSVAVPISLSRSTAVVGCSMWSESRCRLTLLLQPALLRGIVDHNPLLDTVQGRYSTKRESEREVSRPAGLGRAGMDC